MYLISYQEQDCQDQYGSFNFTEVKFDDAYRPQVNQLEVYQTIQPSIHKILDGFNITIFAYGQTGSGKTYTMFGSDWEAITEKISQNKKQQTYFKDLENDKNNAGLIPRCIYEIFSAIEGHSQYEVFCSFLQIYNEKIYDLFQDSSKPQALGIHQSKTEGIFVEGLSQFGVNNFEDCVELMSRGEKNRFIRQTSMNAKSSRSHTIFQIIVESRKGNGVLMKARLNLCDLAGSEKIKKMENMVGDHLKELKNINLSLTTLGKVINSLSLGQKKSPAFRESKLTRLLQESLTSNTFNYIIGNLSPSSKNMQETINTLKFVERANHITLKIKPNIVNNQSQENVANLMKEVEYLREVLNLKKKGLNPEEISYQLMFLKKENDNLRKNGHSPIEIQKLVKDNHKMKKQINELHVQLVNQRSEKSSSQHADLNYTVTSRASRDPKNIAMRYYLPSQEQKSSEKSREGRRSVLVSAGSSIANSQTIENTPSRRNKEKQSMIKKLQALEEKKRQRQHKLIDELEYVDKKGNNKMLSPKKSLARNDEDLFKPKKKPDYKDKIKQLQARLFKK